MSINNASNFGADISFLIITVVLSIVMAIAAIFLLSKFGKATVPHRIGTFLIIIGVGLFARMVFSFFVLGDREDVAPILNLFNVISTDGNLSEYVTGASLSPLAFLVYFVFGSFFNLFNALDNSLVTQLLIKLPLIIADCFSAFVVYKIARKYAGDVAALVLGGAVAVLPVFITASSVYSSVISLCLPFALAGVYFMLNKSYVGTAAFFGAAALICREGVMLLPIPIVFMGYNFVKSIIAITKRKGESGEKLWKEPETRAAIVVPLCFVATLVCSYVISLPEMAGYSYNPASWFVFAYIRPIADISLYSDNALGIFAVFMRVGAEFTSDFAAAFVAVYAVIIFAVVIAVYLFKRNRAVLVLTAAYILLTLGLYYLNSGEYSQLPTLALLLCAYIAVKDKRILYVFFAMTILVTVNSGLSFIGSGYLSMIDSSVFASGGYTGARFFTGALAIVSTVISILAVLTHFYFTYLLLDVSVSDRVRELSVNKDYKFTDTLKAFVRKD